MTAWVGVVRSTRAFAEDARKLLAFFRRDFLTLWSYRLGFFSDWVNLFIQILILSFVGRLIADDRLPAIGSVHPTYVEFAAVGIAIGSLLQANLARVTSAIRSEQLMGTLEYLFLTPTAPVTVLLGSVVYDMVYVPIRTFLLLFLLAVILDVRFTVTALPTVALILGAFLPFLWGISWVSAAGVLTFRRGAGIAGVGAALLVLTSGSYFPVSLLPGWLQTVAEVNPITHALDATREALLGGTSTGVGTAVLSILPVAIVSLVFGIVALRFALRRERERGTLGLY
ncbi:MAG TPA: ABC transporter permease [Actinomycetota bacterium]|nr:ABC transporter permease [Actinomycetota bacterium]